MIRVPFLFGRHVSRRVSFKMDGGLFQGKEGLGGLTWVIPIVLQEKNLEKKKKGFFFGSRYPTLFPFRRERDTHPKGLIDRSDNFPSLYTDSRRPSVLGPCRTVPSLVYTLIGAESERIGDRTR